MAEHAKSIYHINGKPVTKEEFLARGKGITPGQPPMVQSTGWPLRSHMQGCHPDQIPEFQKIDRAHGLSGTYHPDGGVVWQSRKERCKWTELRGLRDNDAGYGDHPGR